MAGGETPGMVEMRLYGSQAFRLGGLWKNLKQKSEISKKRRPVNGAKCRQDHSDQD